MSEILLINPRKRRRRKKTVAKKRVRRRPVTTRRKTTTRRRRTAKSLSGRSILRSSAMPRRKKSERKRTISNPKRRVRHYARRAASRARTGLRGLSFKSALKDSIWIQIGMFGSKWFSKRFGGGASQTDPSTWTWKEYAKGGAGAVATAYICNMIKPGVGQLVLLGGLNIMIYEMVQNELIVNNDWAKGQFGEDINYEPGDVYQDGVGTSYLLGEDYQWRELPESSMTGALTPVGPLGALEPVGPLGALEPVGPLGEDPYRKAYLGN